MTAYPHLELDCINIDNSVMKMLPPEIAYRYHALPVATDGNKVTVAMAAPDDQTASLAVQSVINAPLCLIQADLEEIDYRLDMIWPQISGRMNFLFWPLTSESNRSFNIAKGIARLLKANLDRIDNPGEGQDSINGLQKAIRQEKPDLLIVETDHPSRLCKQLSSRKGNIRQPDLLLLPSNPTLPIKKLLLVLPDSGSGAEKAASWVIRFSQSSRVDVTILPVLPPVPLCYGSFLHHNLASLLAGSDTLGKNMRSISNQFSLEKISANYKLQEGDPFNQIRDEISSSNSDLIILPSNPPKGRAFWFCPDLAGMLFKCVTKPILITNQN
jgi:hypothetical protein